MKRSDLIKILDEDISFLYGVTKNNVSATWILSRLEKIGMLPPERTYVTTEDGDNFVEVTDNTWESE